MGYDFRKSNIDIVLIRIENYIFTNVEYFSYNYYKLYLE